MQVSQPGDNERDELEHVLADLARFPRLASLLRYLADRYFQGKTAEITEYNIATEVFGRSKGSFDGSTDSIARVEAHRLRKRLKEYYEKEGRDHAILISLPYRSYVPEFHRRAASASASAKFESKAETKEREDLPSDLVVDSVNAHGLAEVETVETNRQHIPRGRILIYTGAAIAVLLLASFGALRFLSRNSSASSNGIADAPSPSTNQSPPLPMRLTCQYDCLPAIGEAREWIVQASIGNRIVTIRVAQPSGDLTPPY